MAEEKKNPMREVKIEKVALSIGGVAEELEKGFKLLKVLSGGKTPKKTRATKRIPSLGVRPGLEVGTVVTIRKGVEDMLKKMLVAVDNTVKKKQVSENTFSFGIKEYLEIPGVEYQRDVGIRGLDITVTFKRTGRRVGLRKVRKGKVPKRQRVSKEEIIKFMEENFQVNFIGK